MEQIHFTTKVLGIPAAYRLTTHQLTQTIRSKESSITKAILSGILKVGDQVEVTLDGAKIGLAEYVIMDETSWIFLGSKDATRGGFDSKDDLEQALHRAGYRFKPLDDYQLYRIQFSWLKEVYA